MREQSERPMIKPQTVEEGKWERNKRERRPLVVRWIECFPADGSRLPCAYLFDYITQTDRQQQQQQSGVYSTTNISLFFFCRCVMGGYCCLHFRSDHEFDRPINVSLDHGGISSSYSIWRLWIVIDIRYGVVRKFDICGQTGPTGRRGHTNISISQGKERKTRWSEMVSPSHPLSTLYPFTNVISSLNHQLIVNWHS